MASAAAELAATNDEVKPYRMHVSSRYLDLTKQKLEITRLPHEDSQPRSKDWWEPKGEVEPLIDFWLEQYSWRAQEEALNDELPQFRTAFTIAGAEAPVRIHFVHIRSSHSSAVPLLLIPPFPFTSLSFGHLVRTFTDPEDAAADQPFHLIIPSLPGLAFSDALPNNTSVISTSAEILNALMSRLDYPHYLVTNAGSGSASPAEIDWKLVHYLASQYSNTCLGTHFISPPLAEPKLREAPMEWAKWSIASFFHAPILGYRSEDFSALKRSRLVEKSRKSPTPSQFGLNQLGLGEPNTLAYALCDSPTGLLVFALKSLQLIGPKKKFTPTEIINFTQLSWLPGPEAAMRFWAHCVQHPEPAAKKMTRKPKVAITVFLRDETETEIRPGAPAPAQQDVQADHVAAQTPLKVEDKDGYACPSWANAKYHVVYTHRASGKSGLLAWERPGLIAAGVRGLAKEVLRLDPRLKPAPAPSTAPLEQVVSDDGEAAARNGDAQNTVAALGALALQTPTPAARANSQTSARKGADGLLAPITEERGHPQREISEETRVESDSENRGKLYTEKSDDTLASVSPNAIPVVTPPPAKAP
ncbi:epoxide hydrolase [Pseudomassariella vexata]|uniref:Epoxide hydrolase n=1 Tax=Pseudomassariella vexata TaxID=1141098 RepID=A0A1Y2EK64_9PEZI|nr:epoxide hydrolase [Pseudomassariella vexata]ORY71696.1 epoxide hydrolase [Pseudomassariella vexata]